MAWATLRRLAQRRPGRDDDREDDGDPLHPRGRSQASAALGLVELVTAAAILEDGRREFLERRLINDSRLRRLDVLDEFGEAGVEISLVLPDRRQGRSAAAGLAVVGTSSLLR